MTWIQAWQKPKKIHVWITKFTYLETVNHNQQSMINLFELTSETLNIHTITVTTVYNNLIMMVKNVLEIQYLLFYYCFVFVTVHLHVRKF